MQLSAVFLARVLYFIETVDLNPRGTANFPVTVSEIVKRYGFTKFPQKAEELDEAKGVTFEQGHFRGTTIDRLIIYDNGLQLDTRKDTDTSDAILDEALVWATTLGFVYKPEMVRKKAYVSHFSFYSDAPLLQTNPVLNSLGEKVSKVVSENMKFQSVFQPSAIQISQDPQDQKFPAAPFTIERRAQTPFAEKKYFSSAPLPTSLHVRLVEEYEKSTVAHKA